MNRVILAGATGDWVGYIAKEQRKRSYSVRAIVLNPEKLKQGLAITCAYTSDSQGCALLSGEARSCLHTNFGER